MSKLFHLPPPNRVQWKPGHKGRADLNQQLWRLVGFLTVVVGLGALFQRIPMLVMNLDNANLATAIYLGMLLSLPVAGALWGRQAWHTARLWQSTPEAARNPLILRIVTVIGLLGMLAFVIAHAFAVPTQVRIFHARQAFRYSLTADPTAGVIHVSGLIGPNLASRLDTALSQRPPIRLVEITSSGGLLDESLRAAAVIGNHPQVTVIARHTCESACLPILLAGAQRYADWDMNLSVGQVRPIADMPRAVDQNRMIQTALDVDRLFTNKSLPKNMRMVVRSADAQGVISESAIRLVESRVITGLLNGTQSMSIADAKWRMVERHLEHSGDMGLRTIMTAARDAGSSFIETHAEDVYAALRADDANRLRNSVCGLVAPLAARHVKAYMEPACH